MSEKGEQGVTAELLAERVKNLEAAVEMETRIGVQAQARVKELEAKAKLWEERAVQQQKYADCALAVDEARREEIALLKAELADVKIEIAELRAKLEAAYTRIGQRSDLLTRRAEGGAFDPAILRSLREAAVMTQQAMAERIGLSRNTVVNWETGKTVPDAVELVRLGDLLGVPVQAFFREKDV
jgi:DNA-binding XRE family transcriptional regulator